MNLGMPEMIFIFLLALVIFGPKKLPEIGRQIGKALAEFKRASNEFKWQIEAEMRQLEVEASKAKEDVRSELPRFESPLGTIMNSDNLQALPAPEIQPPNTPENPTPKAADA